jgi:MFS transporter, BCD family, chlorophyll transporter
MSRRTLFRLGLFQIGAGTVSVLLLGVLNRVLRVEMGMDLLLVGVIVGGGHYLGALMAVPFGYYSDRRPIRGLHRTPYMLASVTVVALALATAPLVGRALATSSNPLWPLAGFLFFLLEGVATFIGGTAFLSLITDLTDEDERGRAVAFVWSLLMVGILAGVFFTVAMLRVYSFAVLSLSFAIAAAAVLGLALIALWRQERKTPRLARTDGPTSLAASIALLVSSRQTQYFFAFLVVGLFSTFMQDIILEPFGGEVLQLSIRATSLFNAYQMIGLIAAMWVGGTQLIPRYGKVSVTATGSWIQVAGFGLLTITSVQHQAWLAPPAILILGLGQGLFTVGGVSLMMDMTQSGHTGLFVGAWTLASALARGPASIAASGLHNMVRALGSGPAGAYASVFVVEAFGLVIAVWLLRQVGVLYLRQEVTRLDTILTQLGD